MAVIPIPRSTPHGAKPKNPHAANLNFPRATSLPASDWTQDDAEPEAVNVAAAEPEPVRPAAHLPETGDASETKGRPTAQPVIRRSLPVVTRSAEFRDAFPQRTWLLDGAMATVLFSKGVSASTAVDELNLTLPAVVRDVHREYLAAGSHIVSTNTFGANRIRLAATDPAANMVANMAANMVAINRAGVRIARQAAVDSAAGAFVAGIIGPLGVPLEPMGSLSIPEAQQIFRDQAAALHGVDLFVLETFRDLKELNAAANGVREAAGPGIVMIAQVSVESDGTLGDGVRPEVWMPELDRLAAAAGIDAIGVNCSAGPHATVAAVRQLAAITARPVVASPSAGLPVNTDGRLQYPSSVDYFAAQTRKLLEAGARMVGGCCGTTPDYVRAMRAAVDSFDRDAENRPGPAPSAIVPSGDVATALPSSATPVPLNAKSKLGAKLAAGKFVTIVEVDAPRSHELPAFVATAKQYKKASIDAVAIAAGSRAAGRVPAAAALHLAQTGSGIEAVLNVTARGSNVRGVESILAEASALDLHNVVCLAPEGAGGFPGAGLDSLRIIRLADRLNRGHDLAGNSFDPPSALALGVAVNVTALDPSEDATERKRFEAEIEAGAEFAIAQPVFDRELLETCLRDAEQFGVPVIASVLLLNSVEHADYVRNELLIPIPEAIVRQLADAGSDAATIGIEIARQQVAYLRGIAAGVRVIAAGIDAQVAIRIATGKS